MKIEEGDQFETRKFPDSHIRVLAIRESYVMARRKGCVPFVKTYKQLVALINSENEIKIN